MSQGCTLQYYQQATWINSSQYYNSSWFNSSQHYNNSSEYRRIRSSDIPVYACYVIISITGCVCNGITVAIMARNSSLHTLYNYLLLNLAIADLISSVFSIITFIIILSADQSSGLSDLSATLVCRFFTVVIYCSIILSVVTLTAISLERYLGIVKPLIHRNMTRKRLKYFLLFAWPSAIFGPAILSGELRMDETSYYCFFSPDEKDWPLFKIVLGWIGLTLAYIIPSIMVTTIYMKVVFHMRLKNNEQKLTAAQSPESVQSARQKTTKTIRLLIFISIFFAVSLLPEIVYFMMILLDRKYVDAALFYKIGIPTVAINAVNPLIYTLSNPTFRSAALRFFRDRRQRRVEPLPLTTRTSAQTT